jgi:uncharacterized protein with HEPN domain
LNFKPYSAIEQFTTGIEFEAFSQSLEKVFAVSRTIEILGEAVKRITLSNNHIRVSA